LAALRSRHGLVAEYFDPRAVEALLHRHRSGREDATDRIWRLINLQLWGDLFLTGRGKMDAEAPPQAAAALA
jgi:asparagine synthase (glutamine-hydrolysing)